MTRPRAVGGERPADHHEEGGERGLLGHVLLHPERWPEVRVGLNHFSGTRRRLFRALQEAARGGELPDFLALVPRLRAAGLAVFAIDVMADAWAVPASLRDLEECLHRRLVLRRLRTAGEILIAVADGRWHRGADADTAQAAVAEVQQVLSDVVRL